MNPQPQLPSILIADDSPDDRLLLEDRLRKAGVRNPLLYSDSGNAAIELLRREAEQGRKPAIVFLDVHMPPGDGHRVLEWIRRERTLYGTRVIMVTDSSDPEDLTRAKALAVDGYFLKHPHAETIGFIVRNGMPAPATDSSGR